jgi:cytochrome c-type biogenesis protein CcmH
VRRPIRAPRLAALAAAGALLAAVGTPLTAQAADTAAARPDTATTASDATAGFATPRTAADTGGGAGLSGAALDAETAQVAAQLRCPVCRGQSVLESTATLSKEIQAEIKQRLASGQSPEAVKAYFVSRYGEWILLKPPTHGFSLLVWVLPVVLLVGGLGVAWLWIRSRSGEADAGTEGDPTPAGGPAGTAQAGLSDEERSWLDRAMRND